MKKKLAISVIIPMLLLTGCGDFAREIANVKKEQVSQSTVELSKEEYAAKIGEYKESFTNEFAELGRLQKDTSPETYSDFVEMNLQQIDLIRAIVNDYKKLNPPQELEDAHQYYLDAMVSFDKGLDLYVRGLRTSDDKMLGVAIDHLNEGQDTWNYAFSQVSAIVEIPMGDGTITSDDLKDLDKNAGIDRDSVLTNVSPDGNELVGEWGVEMNGEFKVMIVLGEDGSYKRYKEYPDESSILKGRWDYNHKTHRLTFYNDEAYENDRSILDTTRKKMSFDLQYFADGEMQFMDEESFHTMRYKKESTQSIVADSSSNDTEIYADFSDLFGLWIGINDEIVLSVTLDPEGTFLRGENVEKKIWVRGEWTFDASNNEIIFDNQEAEIGETGEIIFDYPTQSKYKVKKMGEGTMEVEYESGKTITLEIE